MLGKITVHLRHGWKATPAVYHFLCTKDEQCFTNLTMLGIRTSNLVSHERRQPFILFPPGLCARQTRITINISAATPKESDSLTASILLEK